MVIKLRNVEKRTRWCGVGGGFVVLGLVFLLGCCLFAETSVLAVSVSPPEENVWAEMAPMRYARSGLGGGVSEMDVLV